MKTVALENRCQQLGHVYRLVEQFELISRSDLAKLSGIAPASMTGLTKWLIDHQFIMERSVQNLSTRGRPAVGLSLSPFHHTLLCLTLSEHRLSLFECDLNGQARREQHSLLTPNELSQQIVGLVTEFCKQNPILQQTLFAISISVIGKIDHSKTHILQLGQTSINCPIVELLSTYFSQPILLNEHFQLWFLTETTLGNLIRHDDVIYLQLDDDINLSVRLKGALLHQDEHKRMNVDKMLMPRFSALSDEVGSTLSDLERYQLKHQVTFSALIKLIDRYLPNALNDSADKILWFCQAVENNQPNANLILDHLCNNLAYMLMNLINLFSTEKIMLNSPLLRIKQPLFDRLQVTLQKNLLLNELNVDLVTSQYDWNSPLIPSVAIKLGIYDGVLLKNCGIT